MDATNDSEEISYHYLDNGQMYSVDKNQVVTVYYADKKTVEKIIYRDSGRAIGFYEDGKTVKFYKKNKTSRLYIFDELCGELLRGKSIEELELLSPLVAQLPSIGTKMDKTRYTNQMASKVDEANLPPIPEGYKAIYRPNIIKDDDVPQLLKDLGVKIKRAVTDVFVEFDETRNAYVYKDKEGKIYTNKIHGKASEFTNGIEFNEWRYILKEEDYQKINKLNTALEKAWEISDDEKRKKASNKIYSKCDSSLIVIYYHIFCQDDNASSTLYHEAKHILNGILCGYRELSSDYKKPTEEEQYKLAIEEERSAYFESLNKAIAEYYTNGEHFGAFIPLFQFVIDELKDCSADEIKAKLYPPTEIFNKALQHWNDEFLESYFVHTQNRYWVKSCESLFAPADETGEEYRKQLSLKHTYDIYNPYTKKTEVMDLSSAIKVDIPITDKIREEIIKPCQEQRHKEKMLIKEMFKDEKAKTQAANMLEYLRQQLIDISINDKEELQNLQEWAKSAVPVKKTENISGNDSQQDLNVMTNIIRNNKSK